ncbi:MAG: phosphoribosylformylglycinamidine synthase subunit PurQ, partial [Chloroflexi bacterium]|nr:phosphoribosylformylglycinamidine synthase subunit PurQ [Chloroflexota bacterium]
VVFPGTWGDVDCFDVIKDVLGEPVEYVWHKSTDLSGYDCIILPGGFSYGDYLRCGAIARFSPVMKSVAEAAEQGKLVIGICNGFQILCEAGLLPGVLRANDHLQFRCQWTDLRVENASTPFTALLGQGQVISVPISHGEGNYFADAATLAMLERDSRVAFRYCGPDGEVAAEFNPNGSMNNIAGITNARGNVLGMMPHPERCCDELLGGVDGVAIFQSMAEWASGGRLPKVQETIA